MFHNRRIIHPAATLQLLPAIKRAGFTRPWGQVFVGFTLAPGEGGVTVWVTRRAEVEEPGVVGGAGDVFAGGHQTSGEGK